MKEGKTVLVAQPKADEIYANLAQLKRIIITEAAPVYWGTTMADEKPGVIVSPFAELSVTLSFPNTNYTATLNAFSRNLVEGSQICYWQQIHSQHHPPNRFGVARP